MTLEQQEPTPSRQGKPPGIKVVSFLVCNHCDQPILRPEAGVIVQGNIYTASADPQQRGGLVGNNFPPALTKAPDGFMIDREAINEVAYHFVCLLTALGYYQEKDTPQRGGSVEQSLAELIRRDDAQTDPRIPKTAAPARARPRRPVRKEDNMLPEGDF